MIQKNSTVIMPLVFALCNLIKVGKANKLAIQAIALGKI